MRTWPRSHQRNLVKSLISDKLAQLLHISQVLHELGAIVTQQNRLLLRPGTLGTRACCRRAARCSSSARPPRSGADWSLTCAPMRDPRGREAKYASDSSSGSFSTLPSTRTCASGGYTLLPSPLTPCSAAPVRGHLLLATTSKRLCAALPCAPGCNASPAGLDFHARSPPAASLNMNLGRAAPAGCMCTQNPHPSPVLYTAKGL